MGEYNYLLLSIFDRPIEEAGRVKEPQKNFMQLSIWKKMNERQFNYLYGIINTQTLNEDKRYDIFNNTILSYNSILHKRGYFHRMNQDRIKANQRRNKNGRK